MSLPDTFPIQPSSGTSERVIGGRTADMRTYADAGKSGLKIEGRDALRQLREVGKVAADHWLAPGDRAKQRKTASGKLVQENKGQECSQTKVWRSITLTPTLVCAD